jgi:hypothetical protein
MEHKIPTQTGETWNPPPLGSILRLLPLTVYVNDFPSAIKMLSVPIIFPDNTGVRIFSKSFGDLCTLSNRTLI